MARGSEEPLSPQTTTTQNAPGERETTDHPPDGALAWLVEGASQPPPAHFFSEDPSLRECLLVATEAIGESWRVAPSPHHCYSLTRAEFPPLAELKAAIEAAGDYAFVEPGVQSESETSPSRTPIQFNSQLRQIRACFDRAPDHVQRSVRDFYRGLPFGALWDALDTLPPTPQEASLSVVAGEYAYASAVLNLPSDELSRDTASILERSGFRTEATVSRTSWVRREPQWQLELELTPLSSDLGRVLATAQWSPTAD